jgi:hypothetical protein
MPTGALHNFLESKGKETMKKIAKCAFSKKRSIYFKTPYLPHFLSILSNMNNYGCIKRSST